MRVFMCVWGQIIIGSRGMNVVSRYMQYDNSRVCKYACKVYGYLEYR